MKGVRYFISLIINLNKLNKQWGPIITTTNNDAYNLTQNHKNYSHFTKHVDPYTTTFDDPPEHQKPFGK